MASGRIVVYGGRGALGSACVNHFKSANFWVASVDLQPNDKADLNITVPADLPWAQQEDHVVKELDTALQGQKVNAVICVAGGWAGGNAAKDLVKQTDLMMRQSVWSSVISASLASKYLTPGGVLALTGAKAALEGTPGMIGYGVAKAAVHQLTKSLGAKDSGLPENSLAVAILPVSLDTEMNRKWMPKADFSSWTPLSYVAQLFDNWIKGEDRPPSGSLVALVTKDNKTDLIVE
ncbi:dihydropteridine reductase [Danaus plexippus]|uniref:Dihydropteridine reductase n=1 Tax=Danaus plexippus plexippus TaxID=278856 RepID=A0A212FBK7_DANPL|nr:dihydropteridine reductase [Danaus plexippus]OWR51122.1 Dihydropteridine reductase [Danaus plexippus plexippus]